jgi:hypothetical protein
MDEPISTYSSSKKETKSNNLLVLIGLTIGVLILIVAGYFLIREYQKTYFGRDSDVTVDTTNVLQPQFAQRETTSVLTDQKFPVNEAKISYFNGIVSQLGQNRNFLTSLVASYTIEASLQEIKNEGNAFTLVLRDPENNLINISLTNEEAGNTQVVSESPGLIEQVSLFDLKHNDRLSINATINLASDSPNIYRIKVLSR